MGNGISGLFVCFTTPDSRNIYSSGTSSTFSVITTFRICNLFMREIKVLLRLYAQVWEQRMANAAYFKRPWLEHDWRPLVAPPELRCHSDFTAVIQRVFRGVPSMMQLECFNAF